MRQKKWIELLKDYNCTIEYHPGKANIVADALSRKSITDLRAIYCVLDDRDLIQSILREKHSSPYTIHPRGNKMYRDLREQYWM
ncbi:Transposon Ty3-G Gag-Pol polyprotein [Gossypium australe]|uniref:Transposon Ty3-G Gag-Pol polyprotein n=1 Tax=Gossypium australe TaxID=47621 RepID=A0A5B6WDS9_9ROSI|nr:Transposon Ty3-G Gag-Pol polyprotein [Gossypium australe]